MGRTPLFNPERQGEQAFRTTALAGPQMTLAAQQMTQNQLGNSAAALGNYGMPAQNQLTGFRGINQITNARGFKNIADYLRTLGI